jgi:hypothetical protein
MALRIMTTEPIVIFLALYNGTFLFSCPVH